jgi:hypothetical protein
VPGALRTLLVVSAVLIGTGAAGIGDAPHSLLGWFLAAAGIAGTVFYVWLTRPRW